MPVAELAGGVDVVVTSSPQPAARSEKDRTKVRFIYTLLKRPRPAVFNQFNVVFVPDRALMLVAFERSRQLRPILRRAHRRWMLETACND
jgi:hypothetical protein